MMKNDKMQNMLEMMSKMPVSERMKMVEEKMGMCICQDCSTFKDCGMNMDCSMTLQRPLLRYGWKLYAQDQGGRVQVRLLPGCFRNGNERYELPLHGQEVTDSSSVITGFSFKGKLLGHRFNIGIKINQSNLFHSSIEECNL